MSSPAARLDHSDRLIALLSLTSLHDARAFTELYDLTGRMLYPIALRILREPAAAADALQESYVRIWNQASTYLVTRSRPLTWMGTIVRNCCFDELRRRADGLRKGDPAEPDELPHGGPSPLDATLAALDRSALTQCLDSLPAAQVQMLTLAFFHGLSHSEVARHMGQPLGTVKSHIRRGLAWLQRCLLQLGHDR